MHLEVIGRPSAPHEPLITFRADEQDGLQLVLHRLKDDVAFPLAELKRAIAIAEKKFTRSRFTTDAHELRATTVEAQPDRCAQRAEPREC